MEGKGERRFPDPAPGQDTLESILSMPPSRTDPSGSYTGRPQDPHETPEQDADDH